MTGAFLYLSFLATGAVISYEDWTGRRIRNVRISLGLALCGLGLAWLLLNTALGAHQRRWLGFGEYYLPWAFYPRLAVHLALSLAAAIALWRMAIWPAGDAKYYLLCSLFLALVEPNIPGFPRLSFLVLLINIFVPAGLLYAAETVVLCVRKIPRLFDYDPRLHWLWLRGLATKGLIWAQAAWPHRWEYLLLWTNLVVVFLCLRLAWRFFRGTIMNPLEMLLVYCGIYMVWHQLAGLLKDKRLGLAVLALAVATGSLGALLWDWDLWGKFLIALRMTLSFGMFISTLRLVFEVVIERESRQSLSPEGLKAGVILSDDTWRHLQGQEALRPALAERYPDGLSAEEAQAVQGWLLGESGRAQGPAAYHAYRSIPFAIWIFLGALLTLKLPLTVASHIGPWLRQAVEAGRNLAVWRPL